jgi:hypothetical protein
VAYTFAQALKAAGKSPTRQPLVTDPAGGPISGSCARAAAPARVSRATPRRPAPRMSAVHAGDGTAKRPASVGRTRSASVTVGWGSARALRTV